MNDVLFFLAGAALFIVFCILIIADTPEGGCRNSAEKYAAVSAAYAELTKPDSWVDAPQIEAANELLRLKEHSRREMVSFCS